MNFELPRSSIKKRSSLYEQSSSVLDTDRSSIRQNSLITDLYSKFLTISKEITIEHDTTNFNMAQFEKDNHKVQYDQQMQQAKLKRLQNIAQLKRANYELQQRRKKSNKHTNPALLGKNQENYLSTYNTFMKNPAKKLFDEANDSDSDDENKKRDEQVTTVTGVTHYEELKKHPRFLQYTIDRLKEKELDRLAEEKIKHQTLETIKNEINTARQSNIRESLTAKLKIENKQANPEKIADNIFRKLYTKRNKQVSMEEAKSQQRIAKIIDRQENMLETLDDRSLSKENYKKLKTRLGSIINELYHDQKRHQHKVRLPKIANNSNLSHYE